MNFAPTWCPDIACLPDVQFQASGTQVSAAPSKAELNEDGSQMLNEDGSIILNQ